MVSEISVCHQRIDDQKKTIEMILNKFEDLKSVMVHNLERLHDIIIETTDESQEYYNEFTKEFDKMADNKFKLSEKEAFDELWDTMVGEDQDDFTPEYRASCMDVLRKVREGA